ncbi:MAG: MarR family winged helix-turn-helix transcriptional regulator [Xanthobacteraceae bacterium]
MPTADSLTKKPLTKVSAESALMSAFNVGASLRHTYRFVSQAMSERLAPYDISMGMFYFFLCLWKEDGLTQRELSDRVGTMGPGTVEQLRRMQQRGFIKRRASVVDRRKIHVFLTPKGRALKKEILPLARQVNAIALRGMRRENMQSLRECLLQIRQNLRAGTGNEPKTSGRVAANRTELSA